MRKPQQDITVNMCSCTTGHLNVNCPYSTKKQIKAQVDKITSEAVYNDLPNPEDLI